jgi:hypothetical protein
VTYHEAFWVATATAAPVIALANTVSISDIGRVRPASRRSKVSSAKMRIGNFVRWSALAVYAVQVAVLWQSLFALLQQSDMGYPWEILVIVLTTSGLLMVFFNAVVVTNLKAAGGESEGEADDVPQP